MHRHRIAPRGAVSLYRAARLRREAARQELALVRSRTRDPLADHWFHHAWMLVDPFSCTALEDLDDVERYLSVDASTPGRQP
jgi:hypothetical protein